MRKFSSKLLVWYDMSSRRIFVLKLIFLQFWVDSGPGYPKMAGCKFSDPSTPLWGAFKSRDAPRTDPAHIDPVPRL